MKDPVEAMLERRYIEDGGFSARVMQALPPRRSASHARTFILGAAAVAAVATLALGPARSALDAFGAGQLTWPLMLCAAVLVTTALSVALREAEA